MPSIEEFAEMRKGLRKRKRPQLSTEMFGDAPGIGQFEVLDKGGNFTIKWTLESQNLKTDPKVFGFDDLSNLSELENERYELGMLISMIYYEHGREIRNSIPGPREAMMASNPYFDAAEKWEHWAKVKARFFYK